MFKPKYKIIIKKESFYPSEFICLGSQLITIVNILKNVLIPHTWYAADVNACSTIPKKMSIDSFSLKKIGDDSMLVQICAEIDQFLSGVFFAISDHYFDQNVEYIEVETEDKQFRPVPLNGVIIEIRTFDTSFFELYAESENILKKIENKFSVEIINVINN